MRTPSIALSSALFLIACGQESPLATQFDALTICPGIPPKIAAVEINRVVPPAARSGSVVELRGRNFNLLPASTVAWFFSNGSTRVEMSEFHITSPTTGWAVVPSGGLSVGPGQVSLYYTQSYDCSAQGGWPNDIGGNWVNSRFMPSFEITAPSPYPFPVSRLTAVATAFDTIELNWQDNSNNETGFEICEGADVNHTTDCRGTVAANQTSEPMTGAPERTIHCYEVRAVNAAGFEPVPSAAKVCATTPSKPRETGILSITPQPGFDSSMCGFTGPISLWAFEDVNANGIVDSVGGNAQNQPFPGWVELNGGFFPPWDITAANRYYNSSKLIVVGNMASCGPARPQIVAIHFNLNGTTLTPTYMVAGDLTAQTGPQHESIGFIQIGGEFGGGSVKLDPMTRKVSGKVTGDVFFQIAAEDSNGNVYQIDALTHIELDFKLGVSVTDN